MNFFRFIQFGIAKVFFWIRRFMSLSNFGKFPTFISSVLFQLHSLSPLLAGLPRLELDLLVSKRDMLIFFSLFSCCCSSWVVSIFLSSSSLILCSVSCIILLSPSTEIYTSTVVFFSLKLSTRFFFVSSVLCSSLPLAGGWVFQTPHWSPRTMKWGVGGLWPHYQQLGVSCSNLA